ncbi:hypothetical protein PCASD_07654 [Puccinia coronata f. sp. avenae]|uniref:Uncharacterized protein n=1 Tax=Puccinia coronata f. sp. avenae TaxID=200324 RepID=A0A2N5UP45_9BASI|nr:hypothetical protein PCASD_07654 [Puccinia coronata f. sp. avenae]
MIVASILSWILAHPPLRWALRCWVHYFYFLSIDCQLVVSPTNYLFIISTDLCNLQSLRLFTWVRRAQDKDVREINVRQSEIDGNIDHRRQVNPITFLQISSSLRFAYWMPTGDAQSFIS